MKKQNKVYEMNDCSYRVNNNTLEYSHDSTDNEFTPVEYFNDFTVGDLLTLIDNLGQFNISNSMLGTWDFKMNIELNGVHGQK